MTLNTY